MKWAILWLLLGTQRLDSSPVLNGTRQKEVNELFNNFNDILKEIIRLPKINNLRYKDLSVNLTDIKNITDKVQENVVIDRKEIVDIFRELKHVLPKRIQLKKVADVLANVSDATGDGVVIYKNIRNARDNKVESDDKNPLNATNTTNSTSTYSDIQLISSINKNTKTKNDVDNKTIHQQNIIETNLHNNRGAKDDDSLLFSQDDDILANAESNKKDRNAGKDDLEGCILCKTKINRETKRKMLKIILNKENDTSQEMAVKESQTIQKGKLLEPEKIVPKKRIESNNITSTFKITEKPQSQQLKQNKIPLKVSKQYSIDVENIIKKNNIKTNIPNNKDKEIMLISDLPNTRNADSEDNSKQNKNIGNIRKIRKELLDHLLEYIKNTLHNNDNINSADNSRTGILEKFRNNYDTNHIFDMSKEDNENNKMKKHGQKQVKKTKYKQNRQPVGPIHINSIEKANVSKQQRNKVINSSKVSFFQRVINLMKATFLSHLKKTAKEANKNSCEDSREEREDSSAEEKENEQEFETSKEIDHDDDTEEHYDQEYSTEEENYAEDSQEEYYEEDLENSKSFENYSNRNGVTNNKTHKKSSKDKRYTYKDTNNAKDTLIKLRKKKCSNSEKIMKLCMEL